MMIYSSDQISCYPVYNTVFRVFYDIHAVIFGHIEISTDCFAFARNDTLFVIARHFLMPWQSFDHSLIASLSLAMTLMTFKILEYFVLHYQQLHSRIQNDLFWFSYLRNHTDKRFYLSYIEYPNKKDIHS